MITEGIATYFETVVGKDTRSLKMGYYENAYALVKPVIDAFGKQGIEFLVGNLPSEAELDDPSLYHRRAAEALIKNK